MTEGKLALRNLESVFTQGRTFAWWTSHCRWNMPKLFLLALGLLPWIPGNYCEHWGYLFDMCCKGCWIIDEKWSSFGWWMSALHPPRFILLLNSGATVWDVIYTPLLFTLLLLFCINHLLKTGGPLSAGGFCVLLSNSSKLLVCLPLGKNMFDVYFIKSPEACYICPHKSPL